MIGFLYLAVVLDDWSRRIVGWAFSTDLKTRVVLDALDMALATRRPENLIPIAGRNIRLSPSPIAARSLAFGHRPVQWATPTTIQCNVRIDRHRFRSHGEARMAVSHFIEGFYNPSRRHRRWAISRRLNTKGDAMV
jgi:putative transposase